MLKKLGPKNLELKNHGGLGLLLLHHSSRNLAYARIIYKVLNCIDKIEKISTFGAIQSANFNRTFSSRTA